MVSKQSKRGFPVTGTESLIFPEIVNFQMNPCFSSFLDTMKKNKFIKGEDIDLKEFDKTDIY